MRHNININPKALGVRWAGFSLVEVMVAASLLGLLALFTSTYMGNLLEGTKAERGRSTQEDIYLRLNAVAANPDAIVTSVAQMRVGTDTAGNVDLGDCIDTSDRCDRTSASSQIGFNLWHDNGGGAERWAGTPGRPVYYDERGARDCNPAKRNCIFAAVAYWWATCPGGAANCVLPDSIHTRIQILPVPHAGRRDGFKMFPLKFNDDKTAFANRLKGEDIKQKQADRCPVDQKQIGLAISGRPICRCIVKPPGGADPPVTGRCPPVTCPIYIDEQAGTRIRARIRKVLVGFNDDGSPRCENPDSDKQETCWYVNLQGSGDCGPGAWMMSLDYGKCSSEDPDKSGKTGSRDVVSCTNDRAMCCKQSL